MNKNIRWWKPQQTVLLSAEIVFTISLNFPVSCVLLSAPSCSGITVTQAILYTPKILQINADETNVSS